MVPAEMEASAQPWGNPWPAADAPTSLVKPLDDPLVARHPLLGGGAEAEVASVGAYVSMVLLGLEDGSKRPRSAGHGGQLSVS